MSSTRSLTPAIAHRTNLRLGARSIARVLLLSIVACVDLGCTFPKTFYSLDRVYTQGDKPQVLVHKGRAWFWFLGFEADFKNYLADIDLRPDAAGKAQLTNTRHLADDGAGEDSTFTIVSGTPTVVQVQDHRNSSILPWNTTADVLDLNSRRRSRLVSEGLVDAQRDVFAITRSGSRLLVVNAGKAVLCDAVQKKAIGRESQLLVELRRLVIEKCGVPGEWFLTDDLKYIVIAPPQDIHHRGGLSSYPDPTLITVAGMEVDLSESGIIVERATGKLSVFPRRVESDPVIDVENVNSDLRFVYARLGRARLRDSKGNLLAAHSISNRSYGEDAFAGWDPKRGEFWFQTAQGKMLLDRFPQLEADHFIICWNTLTNEEKRYRITGAQIAEAIAKVPWWQ
jgi:hypothetical protein